MVAAHGFTVDTPRNTTVRSASLIAYPPGAAQAAADLARLVGVTATAVDRGLPAGTLRLELGTRYRIPDMGASPIAAPTAAGDAGAALASLTGADIPCVK